MKINEKYLLEKLQNFIADADADELAGVVSHVFGVDCHFLDSDENDNYYEVTPNKDYGGAFADVLEEVPLWKDLSPEEVAEFREWARDNFDPTQTINPNWHPVVVDECKKIIKEKEQEQEELNKNLVVKTVRRPYVKIKHPSLYQGWYGSYDASCVTSRWDCLRSEERKNIKIELWDDTSFVGFITEEEMYKVMKTQQGTVDEKGVRQYHHGSIDVRVIKK